MSVDQDGSGCLRLPVAVLDSGAFSRRPLGPVTDPVSALSNLGRQWLSNCGREEFESSGVVTQQRVTPL